MIGNEMLFRKKTVITFFISAVLLSFLLIEVLYLSFSRGISEDVKDKKISFVKLTGLPDLAFSSQDSYIRHRSLSNVFSIYKDDSTLREYTLSTFSIKHREMN